MDFIEGLRSTCLKKAIFIIMDRLTKYANCIALSYPFTAIMVIKAFFPTSTSYMAPRQLLSVTEVRPLFPYF